LNLSPYTWIAMKRRKTDNADTFHFYATSFIRWLTKNSYAANNFVLIIIQYYERINMHLRTSVHDAIYHFHTILKELWLHVDCCLQIQNS